MNNTAIRDIRRTAIITASRDLFSQKGYHGTSMPDIAHAAGISTGLIYYIFPSKEDILLACCEDTASIHLNIFERTQNIADPLERFDTIVHELYSMLDRESKSLMIVYKDISTLQRETRQRILSMIKNLDNQFVTLIQEGQQAGVFVADIPQLQVLAANVLGLGHMWALQKTWHFSPQITLEDYITAQLTYFHAQLLRGTSH
jgi:AcrR family transcriptional regulator